MLDRLPTAVRRFIIPIYFGIIAVVLLAVVAIGNQPRSVTQVNCFIGSEKSGYLSNEKVKKILLDRYGLEVNFSRRGSIEQVQIDVSQMDCVWPGNISALEIYRELHPEEFTSGSTKFDTIFNSPIVLFSWKPVVDALQSAGLVTPINTIAYTADTPRLVATLFSDPPTTWTELGVPELFGNFNIVSSDPTRSNSGNMFYALIANMLTGGRVATLDTLRPQLPFLRTYLDTQGYMEESSGFLFEQYIRQGMGAYPIITNYESQIIEFAVANEGRMDQILATLRIIYPVPTVYSAHPLIARTPAGQQLLAALKDPELQDIAWSEHGFRSGLSGVSNNPANLPIPGIPAEVTSIIPLPQTAAMLEMLEYLQN